MARLIASLIASLGLLGETPGALDAQVAGGTRIVIDAVALDRDNMPVMDLTPGEVEVWIAGYRVPIAALRPVTGKDPRAARAIVLVLDDVTLHPAMGIRAREIARRFVERMAPGDTMSIGTFNGSSMEMTGERGPLIESIDAYNVRATGVWTIDALGEQVLGVMSTVSRQLTSEEVRRNTIVAIGSAPLFDAPIPPPTVGRELRKEWIEAMRSMAFANASLYVIDPVGVTMGRTMNTANGFAQETGGHTFASTNDFHGAVDRIMREAGNYYLIEVADPPAQRKAELRELDVRVHRKGVTIRARRAIPGTEAPAGR